MNDDSMARGARTLATEVAEHCKLSDEARALLRAGQTPGQFVGHLVESELYSDAARVVAHALPLREAVWWACVCVGDALGPHAPKEKTDALHAAMHWVMNPCEATRRTAEREGKKATMQTPAGCAAMAAFWSSGSISKPDLPQVAPQPGQAAAAVAAAVLCASAEGDLKDLPARRQKFLAYGYQVANGHRRWPTGLSI